jgi:hypothetical protein
MERIKRVFAPLGLTVTGLSELTGRRYGKQTPYFIPPTFRFRWKQGVSPRIEQIVALSQMTGNRFSDWMKFFGFDLELIFALQLRLHRERTVMITPGNVMPAETSPVCPVSKNGKVQQTRERYVFAKIGSRDAVLYPRLVPGSIVRADRSCCPHYQVRGSFDQSIWLVEHAAGLTCCYVKPINREHVLLLPNSPPLSPWPLRVRQQARVLGLVDLVLQPWSPGSFRPMDSGALREARTFRESSGLLGISSLLRACRARAGLTLRAAHEMTMQIARLLGSREYQISLGLLSDYEALNKIPRHIAKMISLSVIYGIDPLKLLNSAGIHIDDRGKALLLSRERTAASGKLPARLSRCKGHSGSQARPPLLVNYAASGNP